MDCSVCCETVKCTECPYCRFAACSGCASTFLLGLSKDPHCMSCNKLWDREVLLNLLGKSFVNGKHKWHRENLLFEREKSLFPQTQVIIMRENKFIELEKIREDTIKEIVMETGKVPNKWHPKLLEIRNVRDILMNGQTDKAKPKKKFVRKCPVGDCKGFLSTSWKCGLCEHNICKDCNEIKTKDHVCDPGNVDTVKLLAKDTKPCPECGEMIFKASGCSQMWCTACHCVFDWNTMEIETGVVHNPHYFEYQRRNGTLQRQPGDVPGGCEAGGFDFGNIWILSQQYPYNRELITNVYRLWAHYDNVRNPRVVDSNLNSRKEFMRGKISEYQFKFRIQKNEKHREKIRDIRNIDEMCKTVLQDILLQLFNKTVTIEEFKLMVENLVKYTNEAYRKIKTVYDNCVMNFIDEIKFEMISDRKKKEQPAPPPLVQQTPLRVRDVATGILTTVWV